MRKHLLTLLALVGLLAGSAVGVTAQDDVASDQAAALVTGRVIHSGESPFAEDTETEGVLMQRGRSTPGRLDMSDPRLSGEVVLQDNADRFCDGPCSEDTFLGDVLWGTIEVTNDGGTWTGTSVGTTDTSTGGGNVTYYELVGSGDYEGLSAVLFEQEAGGWVWNGVIFPGDLPPER